MKEGDAGLNMIPVILLRATEDDQLSQVCQHLGEGLDVAHGLDTARS